MSHWIIAPVLLPLACGIVLLLAGRLTQRNQRVISTASAAALVPVAGVLLMQAGSGDCLVYRVGDWPAPYGIVLVLDRLSALMVLLTAVVGSATLLYATAGADSEGPHFHVLFQFEIMGLNGAFLTGDLFNLFVFFEILLIASYGLLLHGGGTERVRAGLHYVVLNLVGSALFLFALGILYGVTGTLNMADLAVKIPSLRLEDIPLVQAGGLLLLAVFGLKAALFPLSFWLPAAYRNATGPVAGLFAILTKVGVYGIVRVFSLLFGPGAGPVADLAGPWLLPAALATATAGVLGILAGRDLARMLAYGVITSVGVLLSAVAVCTQKALGAAVVYLVHSTLITAAGFLLADLIRTQRGSLSLEPAVPVAQPRLLGILYAAAAMAMVGLPPLSGFMGKLMILLAVRDSGAAAWIWAVVLFTGLLGLLALTRMGIALFWHRAEGAGNGVFGRPAALVSVIALLGFSPLLVIWGEPVVQFAQATAHQLTQPAGYIDTVLGDAYLHDLRIRTGG